MKSIISKTLFAVPTALLLSACSGEVVTEEEKKETDVSMVELAEIENKSFTHEIRVQGNVETEQDVLLNAEMGGLIISINVKEGQRVVRGQVIAQVDASILSSTMEELRTQLEYAEYILEKQQALNKRGVGSEFELETAQSQVNTLKANMKSLSTQQGKATIRAPFSGVIDQVFARKGQVAGPISPIVRLVNNATVDIVATISEKHLANVKVGTPINVSFPNFGDTSLALSITSVGNYIEPTNRTFRITSTIKNNTLLLPNMLAEVRITDMQVDSGIVIPSSSISKDQNNNDFVFIARKIDANQYKVTKTNVVVIQKFESNALIETSSEFEVGQLVVTRGTKGIGSGEIVKKK